VDETEVIAPFTLHNRHVLLPFPDRRYARSIRDVIQIGTEEDRRYTPAVRLEVYAGWCWHRGQRLRVRGKGRGAERVAEWYPICHAGANEGIEEP
jgi:hypothetical protein